MESSELAYTPKADRPRGLGYFTRTEPRCAAPPHSLTRGLRLTRFSSHEVGGCELRALVGELNKKAGIHKDSGFFIWLPIVPELRNWLNSEDMKIFRVLCKNLKVA
jgi:hypothetical protein